MHIPRQVQLGPILHGMQPRPRVPFTQQAAGTLQLFPGGWHLAFVDGVGGQVAHELAEFFAGSGQKLQDDRHSHRSIASRIDLSEHHPAAAFASDHRFFP